MAGRKEDQWREPTEDEIVLLTVMVEAVPAEQKGTLTRQIEGIRVRRSCECGCPSLEFEIASSAPVADEYSDVLSVGYAVFDDSAGPFSLELFIRQGRLRGYDVTPIVEPPSPDAKLSRIETLRTRETIWSRDGD